GREAKQIANFVLEGHGSAPLPDGSLLVGKDGTQCPIEGTAAAIEDTNSAATGAVFIVRDITERTERERLVRAALTHAEHITATVREPLIVLDETLRVQSANRSFYQVFQVSKEDT